jgi:16S rRNA (guanine527-N7)-methyltransferase
MRGPAPNAARPPWFSFFLFATSIIVVHQQPELLSRGLESLGLPPSGELFDRLCLYVSEIERLNPVLGLVAATGDELVIKHILDSLAPIGILRGLIDGKPDPRIADLGSGAGLPGIPLALALPEARVALVDRMTRRTDFLREILGFIPVDNAEVIEAQVEHAKGEYDLVVFRAFRPFERKLFRRVFALCDAGGAVAAYKGRIEKTRAELSQIDGLYSSVEIIPTKVPFLEDERCIVVFRPLPSMKSPAGR